MDKTLTAEAESAPLLSVIVPVQDGELYVERSLAALQRSSFQDFELIVVDDGSRDRSVTLAEQQGAKVISSGGRLGCPKARNVGAKTARGSILVFVDMDVVVHENALSQIVGYFEVDPSLSALFGAYDDRPAAQSLVSRFRNLLNAYVHKHGRKIASTFWGGLGAVRRDVFEEVGGFWSKNVIEDVEFGSRLYAAQKKIELDPTIQGTHLKRWTFGMMVWTDIFLRGIPWIQLAFRWGGLRNDLNTTWNQRVSVATMGVLLIAVAAASVLHGLEFVAPAFALIVALTLPEWESTDRTVFERAALGMRLAFAAGAVMALWVALMPYAAFALGVAALVALLRAVFVRQNASDALGGMFALFLVLLCFQLLALLPISLPTIVVVLALALELALNWKLFLFFCRSMGVLNALVCVPLLIVYHISCGVAFVLGTILYVTNPQRQ